MIRLASGSPRRRELLSLLGVPFEVVAADIDERSEPHPALAKARAVARPGALTLAADTVIELDGERIGKPADAADAVSTLQRLAGRPHVVRTEVAFIAPSGRGLQFSVRSTVAMKPADDAAIRAYVATGEPLDRAGAYAIQGRAAAFITRVEGSFSGVVGLPLAETAQILARFGMPVL